MCLERDSAFVLPSITSPFQHFKAYSALCDYLCNVMQDTQFCGTSLRVDEHPVDGSTMMLQSSSGIFTLNKDRSIMVEMLARISSIYQLVLENCVSCASCVHVSAS